ncbi:MAG: hypothetical protein KF850_01850 [Labilithrix sp.]|nr:hypothetical protein [Labilithrix sp.]
MRMLAGTHESVYEYDGESRRVRVKELTSSVETKNETFVWCGDRICQKRASNGSTVLRTYFGEGFEESGTTDYFYTRDHLGSVREVVGSDGTTVASRLSYDPWGKITETGLSLTNFAFTGHHFDLPTGLSLTWYRGYDPNFGRWLSKDPLGLQGGLNLYGYVNNDPIDLMDPYGLQPYRQPSDPRPPLPIPVVPCTWLTKGSFARNTCCQLACQQVFPIYGQQQIDCVSKCKDDPPPQPDPAPSPAPLPKCLK